MTSVKSQTVVRMFSAALLAGGMSLSAAAQCVSFGMTQGTASITPGTVDVGNHCDDCTTGITLPFPVLLYNTNYSAVQVSSNGNLQFTTNNNSYSNACLPQSGLGLAICAYWDDLRTDASGDGIFTSTSGVSPNRIFNIEWRSHYFSGGGLATFEVRLFEDQSHFEIIYGSVANSGASATVGVQHPLFTVNQFECNAGGISAGQRLTYTCSNDPTSPVGNGTTSPSTVFACGANTTSLLTVNVIPGFNPSSTGLAVSADLSSINGLSNQQLYDDASHGDAVSGDNIFSFRATITPEVSPGTKSLTFTVSDAQNRSSSGNVGITVNGCPTRGPDVFVAELIDIANYGAVGNVTAFAVGTDACNNGDVPVSWFASINEHPVIAQNMYRLKNGRFEQLGQSWLKHGFSSTNSGTCGTCQSPPQGGQQLGVTCSDAYGSGLNGSQGGLGPRSQVNATTGYYPYPFTAPAAPATIGRRLQVYTNDIDPSMNSGARYFVEGHYVTSDDARWNNGTNPATNGLNNSSYREISIGNVTGVPSFVSGTVRMAPGIQAWKNIDATVQLVTADYLDTTISAVGIIGRFWVAGKATNNGNGTWHYEYAVYNHNADRNGGSFSIPTGPGVIVSNVGFHGVFAHSGEPYPNAAANPDNWQPSIANLAATWHAPEPFVGPNGDSANALRWGTMYNFRFDANVAPATGSGTVGLFKPGTPAAIPAANIPVPGPASCIADFDDGSGTGRPDGGVGIEDLLFYLSAYDQGVAIADVDDGSGTGTRDGGVGIEDLLYYLARYDAGC